jgi:hypothetical protein
MQLAIISRVIGIAVIIRAIPEPTRSVCWLVYVANRSTHRIAKFTDVLFRIGEAIPIVSDAQDDIRLMLSP